MIFQCSLFWVKQNKTKRNKKKQQQQQQQQQNKTNKTVPVFRDIYCLGCSLASGEILLWCSENVGNDCLQYLI